MIEDPRAPEAVWAEGKSLFDVVPALDTVVETIGRDLALGEYALAQATVDFAAAMLVEHGESTARLVVRALAESEAATEPAQDALSS